jgi:hypothetical protein
MRIDDRDGWYDDSVNIFSYMDSLADQLEADYEALKSLLKIIKRNTTDILKINQALIKIAWIKREMKMFKLIEKRDIEGVLRKDIAYIERDIMAYDEDLKTIRMIAVNENFRK